MEILLNTQDINFAVQILQIIAFEKYISLTPMVLNISLIS